MVLPASAADGAARRHRPLRGLRDRRIGRRQGACRRTVGQGGHEIRAHARPGRAGPGRQVRVHGHQAPARGEPCRGRRVRPGCTRPVLPRAHDRNIGDRAQIFDGSDQKLIDRNGSKYSADVGASLLIDGSESFLEQINPGNAVDGIVVFDIPKGADPVRIELHDSLLSGGITADLTRRS
ncbi:DUF4352 domain-containing protein [Streptomyces sp. NPDC056491]|uniref:DUF4352 domain-containing protein n=1 Tax=Streptomyces sp. NPDC056491 TaxID=3345837 RepID=UPI0036CBA4B9